MIASILLFITILFISLDSIGSKRLRRRLIRQAKFFFASSTPLLPTDRNKVPAILEKFLDYSGQSNAAPIQTLRFRWKGAQQNKDQKPWQPLEVKQFQTVQPLTMIYYEDRTLGFLISEKRSKTIIKELASHQRLLFSLFPYGKKQKQDENLLTWMHYFASMAWYPDLFLGGKFSWQTIKKQQITTDFTYQQQLIRIVYTFKANGQPISCNCFLIAETGTPETQLSLEYQYQAFEKVESWQVPLKATIQIKGPGLGSHTKIQLTQLIYNEDFAWW